MELVANIGVPVWVYEETENTWIPFFEEVNLLIEESNTRKVPHLSLPNGIGMVDFNYNQLCDPKGILVRGVRRTFIPFEISRPNTHSQHPLLRYNFEESGNMCFYCRETIKGTFYCKTCNFHVCVACAWFGDDYPPHRFSKVYCTTSICHVCSNTVKISGYNCGVCGMNIHKKCYVETMQKTRCPQRKRSKDELFRICALLPKSVEISNKYFIYWRKGGLGYYFFGPGMESRYVVGRVDGSTTTILKSLKKLKTARSFTFPVWESFCKSELTLKFLVEASFYSLVTALKLLEGHKSTEARNRIKNMTGCVNVITEFTRGSDAKKYAKLQVSAVRCLISGMTMSHVTSELNNILFDLSCWNSSNDTIAPPSLMCLLPDPVAVDSLCQRLCEVCYSRYAIAEMWEGVFFRFLIGLFPVPGLKLCYSAIRLVFYAFRGDKQEVFRSAIGIVSGILAILGLFGIETGITQLFQMIVDTNTTLSLMLDQVQGVIEKVADVLAPFQVLHTALGNYCGFDGKIQIIKTVSESTADATLEKFQHVLTLADMALKEIAVNILYDANKYSNDMDIMVNSDNLKIQVTCEFWLINRHCPQGDKCRYLHKQIAVHQHDTAVLQVPTNEYNKITCQNWLLDKCNYGDNCPYLHKNVILPNPEKQLLVSLNPDTLLTDSIYSEDQPPITDNATAVPIVEPVIARPTKPLLEIMTMANGEMQKPDYDKASTIYTEILQCYQKELDTENLIKVLNNRSTCFKHLGREQESLADAEICLVLSKTCPTAKSILPPPRPSRKTPLRPTQAKFCWFYEHNKKWKNYTEELNTLIEGFYTQAKDKAYSAKHNKSIYEFNVKTDDGDTHYEKPKKLLAAKSEIRRGTWFLYEDQNDHWVPYSKRQTELLEYMYMNMEDEVLVTQTPRRVVLRLEGGNTFRQFRQTTGGNSIGYLVLRGYDKMLQHIEKRNSST